MLRIVAAVIFVISFVAAESPAHDFDGLAHHPPTVVAFDGMATGGPMHALDLAYHCHDLSCTHSLALPDRYVFLPRRICRSELCLRSRGRLHAASFERDPPVPRTEI